MRILVVEDEARIQSFLARGLEAEGFTVDTAPDGATALRRLDDVPYDLVVLDLLLPRIDGLTVLRELTRSKPELPVLILSAFPTEQAVLLEAAKPVTEVGVFNGRRFFSGTIAGKSVVVGLTGIGMVNADATTDAMGFLVERLSLSNTSLGGARGMAATVRVHRLLQQRLCARGLCGGGCMAASRRAVTILVALAATAGTRVVSAQSGTQREAPK